MSAARAELLQLAELAELAEPEQLEPEASPLLARRQARVFVAAALRRSSKLGEIAGMLEGILTLPQITSALVELQRSDVVHARARGRFGAPRQVGPGRPPRRALTAPFSIGESMGPEVPEIPPAHECPACRGSMVLRNGPRGRFFGCRAFPECRGTREVTA